MGVPAAVGAAAWLPEIAGRRRRRRTQKKKTGKRREGGGFIYI